MYVIFHHSISINRVYLGTDTRAQCLFIGAALAVGLVMLTKRSHAEGRLKEGELWSPAGRTGRLICGLVGIIGAVIPLVIWVATSTTSSFPYSGGFFLIGLGTAGVIASAVGAPRSVIPRTLSLGPIRYVGQISYGLYIWHWPLFIWVNEARTGLVGYELFGARALVTFAVSVASYHLVEQPIRRGSFLRQWKAWVAVPTGLAVVIASMVAATAGTSALASTTLPPAIGTLGGSSTTTSSTLVPTSLPPVRVLLFGDSVALTLGEGLADPSAQAKYNYILSDKGILGCGVVMGPEVNLMGARAATPPACSGAPLVAGTPVDKQPWPYQWLNAMSQTHPSVVVLLAGRWEVVDRQYQGKWTNILNPAFAAYVKHQLELTSELVVTSGSHLVFLTAPCTDEGEQPDGAPWPEDNPARLAEYNRLIRQVAAEHAQTDSVVDLNAAACPGNTFTTSLKGVVIRRADGVHFTNAGGIFLSQSLMPPIVASGRAQLAGAGTTTTTSAAG
jgi:hypothetical protein